MLRIAKVIPRTTVEGPFERCAIWVSGCTLACPGCCNPELFEASAGTLHDRNALLAVLDRAVNDGVEGITVLGGEPLQQLAGVAALATDASSRGLGTIVFTGYTLAQAQQRPGFQDLWSALDTLVDGPFDVRQPDRRRRFIGSENQGLRHRTRRYTEPGLWRGRRQIEVRVDPSGQVEVHGMPRSVSRFARSMKRD